MNQFNKKKHINLFFCIQLLLFIWIGILLFLEKDYIGSIQILVALAELATIPSAVISYAKGYFKLNIFIVILLLIINSTWTFGICKNRNKSEVSVSGQETVESVASSGNNNDTIILEKELKRLDLSSDHFFKSLEEYTNAEGTDKERITGVIEKSIDDWMKEWDTFSLGKASVDYREKRNEIDEIYTIRCEPESESEYLKEMAVEDYDLIIQELDVLYEMNPNPELLKEKATKCVEVGDLCQKIGRRSVAGDYYSQAIDIAWKGLEESIKYGMASNAKEISNILSTSYGNINVLTKEYDSWDRNRANIIKEIFQDLSDSFDARLSNL